MAIVTMLLFNVGIRGDVKHVIIKMQFSYWEVQVLISKHLGSFKKKKINQELPLKVVFQYTFICFDVVTCDACDW